MNPIGTGHCETLEEQEFPHFPGSGLYQGDLVDPQAVWEAPDPLPPELYLRAGAARLEGITRLSRGEVCPSSGAGTPPARPGLGGAHKTPLFLAWNEWIGGSRIGCQPATPETPRVRQREGGQVEERIDGGKAGLWRDPFLCLPGGCGTSSPSWGPALTADTMPDPWMHQSALEMLTQHLGHSFGSWLPPGAKEPWEWCQDTLGLAQIFGTVCRGW